jgi:C1A family cysteine protease
VANVVNPVKDQAQCGSCWAFSTIGALESGWAIKKGTLLSLSEQQLVDCDRDQDQGCNGGLMDNAFTYIEGKGIETEADYKYKAVDGKCAYAASKKTAVALTGFTDVAVSDAALAAAVTLAPVAIGVAANNAWQSYSSGILTLKKCPNGQLDHGVVAVGFTAT